METFILILTRALLGLLLTTIANEIIEYLSFKNLPEAKGEFYNCLNNIEFDDNIQIDKESLYAFLNDIRESYVSGNLPPINTSKEVMKFIGMFGDLTLNKISKELMNSKGEQTSSIKKDLNICCTMFHERLFVVEEPILTINNDIVAMALKRYDSAVIMLYDCFKKYGCLPHINERKLNHDSFRESTIRNLKYVISKTSTPQYMVNVVRTFLFGNNPIEFGKYCSAAYYTLITLVENHSLVCSG
ncbi:uncharacterized protein LOC126894925 [Daktulosphaira vitifoliae]|uniref:uncharacterized protein LOC126894925 n=1 Tax=Daktulosphaira vitifoliae TaxID=58002 RepID=UPI0021AA4A24|nr:uncharacterized protein LOC126894925 [Daktulosphaira vitifoliae]